MRKSSSKILSLVLAFFLILPCFSAVTYAKDSETIVILYESNVNCVVSTYSKLASMKKELKEEFEHVGVVSSGDFVQGGTLGAISKGEYIVNLMNLVGYDAITPGNHEFDYYLPRLHELAALMNTKPLSCNFYKIGEEKPVFEPYKIVSYGDVDVAYIGITTASTFGSTNPAQFKNEKGEHVYTFNDEKLCELVQSCVDSARDEGADIVIALSHLGYEDVGKFKGVEYVIGNTEGIDAFLDGHTNNFVEGITLKNKQGDDVLLTTTGTGFGHIGKLTISGNDIKSELIKAEDYDKTDKEVDEYLAKINEEYARFGERVIAESEADLITHNGETRLVKNNETNLGNLCADAFYTVTGADIAFVNGGGIRAPIKAGKVTFNDIYTVFPFNNQLVTAELTGRTIMDFLEMGLMHYPEEDGSFPHVAGITFSVDTSIPTSVKTDENEVFKEVGGEYRVYDVRVLNRATGEYEPMEADKLYTFACIDYFLISLGGGMSMLEDAKIISNNEMLDVECVEKYLTEHLGGVIDEKYGAVRPRITFTNGKSESAEVQQTSATEAFTDLEKDAWYTEPAQYVISNDIMRGTGESTFSPDEGLTRGMLVTILYRADGEPASVESASFSDVEKDKYYAPAISWARANDIVNGVTETEFEPDSYITREQLSVIMQRYAQYKGFSAYLGEEIRELPYEDYNRISEYAKASMQYATDSGIIKGKTATTLAPKDTVTRIEAAAVLYRFNSNAE